MADENADGGGRYWAFISYSHKDAAFGRRLHRQLEGYVLPRRLARRAGADPLPRRLVPIFRDRDEFPASGNLSAEVRAALAQSRSLIVVCSPAAAASAWVAREVELFQELHPDRPVLAAIREGEPHECFPPPLRRAGIDGVIVEPLAADFRRGQDGSDLALLKLLAGIAGIGLDELVQRDAQRNFRRVTAITVSSIAAVLVMAALTAFALNARDEADHQRTEAEHLRTDAEGLVDFMLTNLRKQLKGVGRLDIMTAVNKRALDYYAHQDLSRLPPESLERRAAAIQSMGDDDEHRGELNVALKEFLEARRTTAALLAVAPDNPERIFDQSQNEFWIGTIDYERHRKAAANASFLAYKRLTDRLVAIAPENPKYLREAGYADGNLCSIALRKPKDPPAAVRLCGSALVHMEESARHTGVGTATTDDIVNRHAWLADAYFANGDLARARAERLSEERILDGQIAIDPKNMNLKAVWVALQIGYARIDERQGRRASARDRLERARGTLNLMTAFDPANKSWQAQVQWVDAELQKLR